MYVDPPPYIASGSTPIKTEAKLNGNDLCTYTVMSAVEKTNRIVNSYNPIDSNTYPSATVQSKFFTQILAGNRVQSLVNIPNAYKTKYIDLVDWSNGEYSYP